MGEKILDHYLNEFRSGRDVLFGDAECLFDALISGASETILSSILSAWNEKGTTEDELFYFTTIMRRRMKRVDSRHASFVDIVGTGGTSAKTFNVSTAAAFVIAGAGLPVAKHGNRAATSKSGSSDVLSLLGIDVDIDAEISEKNLNEGGLCFMFAPRFHSLSPTLANARRKVRKPTIFNNLGPLCNPASAPHQVIGVWDEKLLESTANVLARLGASHSWVVHAHNGLDEIALEGTTTVAAVKDGKVSRISISAENFGIFDIEGAIPSNCSAKASAELIEEIINGKRRNEAAETLVIINAAAAIFVAGQAKNLSGAFETAEASIRSGQAREKLKELRNRGTK